MYTLYIAGDFKGENFDEFHFFVPISESFLCECFEKWCSIGSANEKSVKFSP